jgi:hypothetical protein
MDTLGAAIQRFEERSAAQYASNFIEPVSGNREQIARNAVGER